MLFQAIFGAGKEIRTLDPNLGKDADQNCINDYKSESFYFKGIQVFLCIRIFMNSKYNNGVNIFMVTSMLW